MTYFISDDKPTSFLTYLPWQALSHFVHQQQRFDYWSSLWEQALPRLSWGTYEGNTWRLSTLKRLSFFDNGVAVAVCLTWNRFGIGFLFLNAIWDIDILQKKIVFIVSRVPTDDLRIPHPLSRSLHPLHSTHPFDNRMPVSQTLQMKDSWDEVLIWNASALERFEELRHCVQLHWTDCSRTEDLGDEGRS